MAITYLKKAAPPRQQIDDSTHETVARMLADIEAGGDEAAVRWARVVTQPWSSMVRADTGSTSMAACSNVTAPRT